MTQLLEDLELSAQAAGRAFAKHDKETAYRHMEDAQSYRNAITLQLRILERKLEDRP